MHPSDPHDLSRPTSAAPPMQLGLTAWKPGKPGSATIGWADVLLRGTLEIRGCGIHRTPDGRLWVSLPSTLQVGRDGVVKTKPNGKPLYTACIVWTDKATAARFEDGVIELVTALYPNDFSANGEPA